MKRMREILDEAAYAADTPEDEAVVEFGWELYDIFKNSLESDKHSSPERISGNPIHF